MPLKAAAQMLEWATQRQQTHKRGSRLRGKISQDGGHPNHKSLLITALEITGRETSFSNTPPN